MGDILTRPTVHRSFLLGNYCTFVAESLMVMFTIDGFGGLMVGVVLRNHTLNETMGEDVA